MGTDVVLSVAAGAAACCYIFHRELPREERPFDFQDVFQEQVHSLDTAGLPVSAAEEGDATRLDKGRLLVLNGGSVKELSTSQE